MRLPTYEPRVDARNAGFVPAGPQAGAESFMRSDPGLGRLGQAVSGLGAAMLDRDRRIIRMFGEGVARGGKAGKHLTDGEFAAAAWDLGRMFGYFVGGEPVLTAAKDAEKWAHRAGLVDDRWLTDAHLDANGKPKRR